MNNFLELLKLTQSLCIFFKSQNKIRNVWLSLFWPIKEGGQAWTHLTQTRPGFDPFYRFLKQREAARKLIIISINHLYIRFEETERELIVLGKSPSNSNIDNHLRSNSSSDAIICECKTFPARLYLYAHPAYHPHIRSHLFDFVKKKKKKRELALRF